MCCSVAGAAAVFPPSAFDRQSFRAFFKIDSLPAFDDPMVIDFKSSHRFADTYVFRSHCLYYQLLKFWCVPFVRFSFWHNKSPHLLSSIPYCLTNGVQFIGWAVVLLLAASLSGESETGESTASSVASTAVDSSSSSAADADSDGSAAASSESASSALTESSDPVASSATSSLATSASSTVEDVPSDSSDATGAPSLATSTPSASESASSIAVSDTSSSSEYVVMVWIPTHGGTKYHSRSSCSGMEDPQQVTLEQAQAQGFTPCKRCY